MKKIYLVLMLLVGFVFTNAQGPVSFSVQGDADDWQLYMSSKLIEDINNNRKMVFVTLTAGDEGLGSAAASGTTSPYYLAREIGSVYSAKFAADISPTNGGTIEFTPTSSTTILNGHSLTKYTYKNTVNYFLRLPDGGVDGAGYAATGLKSLQKLENGDITTINSVDGVNTYNGWSDLSSTILAIIDAEKNSNGLIWMHTASLDETYNIGDNSDNVFSAMAAQEATSYLSAVGLVEFVGESSSSMPTNLSNTKFQDASGVFAMSVWSLTQNKYPTKFTAANLVLLPMDYYRVVRQPSNCDKSASLTTTSITSNSARLSWSKITDAFGYSVDYKTNSGTGWINISENIVDTFVNLSGLSATTLYQWRVRTKCTEDGKGSGYTNTTFTTAASVTCNPPTGLSTTNISTNGAKLNWNAIAGVVSYTLEGKLSSSTTWSFLATTTNATYTVTGLAEATSYQWRVKTNCSTTISSTTYTQAQFTTLASCRDILEYNNSYYYAKSISTGVNYNAQIANYCDKDYYKFNNTSTAKNIKITLTNLPYDYDVRLYDACGRLVGISQNWGTNSETIIINTYSGYAVGTYRVLVYGYNWANSNTKCYNLKVEISSTPFSTGYYNSMANISKEIEKVNDEFVGEELVTVDATTSNSKVPTVSALKVNDVKVYPMPVYSNASLSFEGSAAGEALITISSAIGREVYKQQINVTQGHNIVNLNLLSLTSGIYSVTIKCGDSIETKKLVIAR